MEFFKVRIVHNGFVSKFNSSLPSTVTHAWITALDGVLKSKRLIGLQAIDTGI